MKNCSSIKRHIPLFVDGELSIKDEKAVAAHVQTCGLCANELRDMQIMQQMFNLAEKYQAPYGFAERVIANAVSPQEQKGVFVPCFTKVIEAVVFVIIIAVGIASGNFLVPGHPSPEPDTLAVTLSLDIFETAPPGSIGDVYLAVEGTRHEK